MHKDRYLPGDPIIHSYQMDILDDSHPWANKTVYCAKCQVMLHAENNECIRAWIEFDGTALCAECAQPYLKDLWSVWCFKNPDGSPLKTPVDPA